MSEFDFDVSTPAPTTTPGPTYRDAIRRVMPRWLQGGVAEKIGYSIGVHLDGFVDMLAASVKLRFPNLYSGETLDMLGRDRRIRRGPSDTDATYASRLIPWLDDHRTRGAGQTLLRQIHRYFAPNNFEVDLVYRSGRRYHMTAAGVITCEDSDCLWEADDLPEKYARWALYYQWPVAYSTDGKWGDAGAWGDGGVWAVNVPADVVEDLRAIPTEWNNGHSLGAVVLVNGTDLLWGQPAGALWANDGSVWDSKPRVRLPIV